MSVEITAKNRENMISNITIESAKNISPADEGKFLDEVMAVEKSWPSELQASREKFVSRLHTFPEGFLVARRDNVIKGVTTSQIVVYDPNASGTKTWDEITDNGMIEKTHTPEGNALYVVSVGVATDARGERIGEKIVKRQKELATELGLRYLYLGARIPGYNDYCKEHGEIGIEEYAKLTRINKEGKGEAVDPEFRFYNRCGLEIKKIIPEFELDVDSRNYGAVMVWENPQKV